MGRYRGYVVIVLALVTIGLTLVWPTTTHRHTPGTTSTRHAFGWSPKAPCSPDWKGKRSLPFIDTTPKGLRRAHVAITDSTANCAPGAAAPSNIQILVGEAGVALVNVMTEATNTGISVRPDKNSQCVFHATVRPGQAGVPDRITDIVVFNAGDAPLTGINTVTVSAEVP